MDYSLFVIFVIILQPIDQIFALESSSAVINSTNKSTVDKATKRIPVDDKISTKVGIFFASAGILLNALLLVVMIVDPLKKLHEGAWIIITNIGIADMLACSSFFAKFYIFVAEAHFMDKDTMKILMGTTDFFSMFGMSASFILLTGLNLQMYVIVKYPIRARLVIYNSKVIGLCLTIWIIASGIGMLEIAYTWLEDERIYFCYIANIAALEMAVIIQSILKFFIAKELYVKRSSEIVSPPQTKKQRDVAKTVLILNLIIILTALPYFVAKQIELVARMSKSQSGTFLNNFPYYYEPIALLNFVINPIVYSLRLKDYRSSVLALIQCKKERRRPTLSNERTKRLMQAVNTNVETL